MTELAVQNGHAEPRGDMLPAPVSAPVAVSPLVQWAYEARQAAQIAQSLARTSFVPASLRGKPEDITAAILAGQELGLQPMATLRSMDVIQGTPALRAHAMRGLVQSHGHSVQVVESTPERCLMRGRRKGEEEWQQVEWTMKRAADLGLTGKAEWKKQPQTMLVARATGEICRLVASDVLYAMPYAAEELDAEGGSVERVTTEEILARPAPAVEAAPPVAERPPSDQRQISKPQLAKMGALMTQAGLAGRDAALAYVNETLGRTGDNLIASRSDLNRSEAGRIIDALEAELSAATQGDAEPFEGEPSDASGDWPPVAQPSGGFDGGDRG